MFIRSLKILTILLFLSVYNLNAQSVPELIAPTDSATDISTTVTLEWHSADGANSYNLQLATDSSFNNRVVDTSGMSDTTLTVENLAHDSTYYWRVSSSSLLSTSDWSDAWQFTTIPDTPAKTELHMPEDRTDSLSGDIRFEWHATPQADSYQLQVATDSQFKSINVYNKGLSDTQTTVSGLDNDTTHFWRVRGSNTNGTGPWSDVWKFTTEPSTSEQPPGSPQLSSPVDGTTNLTPKVTLEWDTVSNAESYSLQLARDSSFDTLIVDNSSLSDSTYTTDSLDYNRQYYWRVQATNQYGSSAWSSSYNFTTKTNPDSRDEPLLSSPNDNADNQPLTLDLSWNSFDGANSYQLQVAADSGFNTLLHNENNVSSTSFGLSDLSHDTTYHWRVRANLDNSTSNWSDEWQFITVEEAPPVVDLIQPEQNANDVTTAPSFTWDSAARAESYQLQISRDLQFGTIDQNLTELNDTSQSVTGLNADTTYYWRVRAKNAGGTGNWSDVWHFTTTSTDSGGENKLNVPILSSPENGADSLSTRVTMKWDTVAGAEQYGLRVATDSSFNTIVYDSLSISDNNYTISDLQNNQIYYWKVNASNSNDTSRWSDRRHFTTRESQSNSNSPNLLSPQDGADNQPLSLTLSWDANNSGDSFHLQVALDSDFSTIVRENSNLSSTSHEISDLSHDTTFYWRVRANQLLGTSDWSDTWEFTTVEQAPARPTLLEPENNAENLSNSATFKWQIADRADSYQLQVSSDDQFSSPETDVTNLQGTSHEVSGLDSNTLYYWRVRAMNDGGTSSWSQIWNFKTASGDTTTPPDSGGALSPPTLASPTDGSKNLDTTVELSWNRVSGANTYELLVAKDSLFNNKIVQLDGITSDRYPTENLSYNTTYYWRVRAQNDTSLSDWSTTWSFKTEMGPYIHLQQPENGHILETGKRVEIQWTSNKVEQVQLSYSSSTESNWTVIEDEVPAGDNQYSWEVPDLTANTIELRIKNASGTNPVAVSPPLLLYEDSFQLDASYAFSSSPESKDYRLIALPGSINMPVEKVLGGSPGEDWAAYYDNGQNDNFMVKYDGSDTFTFKPGNGFWIVSNQSVSFAKQLNTVSLDSNEVYQIKVHQGWNIISNPYPVPVSWSAVRQENNLDRSLWSFNGSYQKAGRMDPKKGYYYYHDSNTNQLSIPFAPDTLKNKITGSRSTADSLVQLSVYVNKQERGSIAFGFTENFKDKAEYAPPAPFKDVRLTLVNTEAEGRRKHLSTRVQKKKTNGNYVFEVSLRTHTDETLKLKLSNNDRIAQNIYWVNPSTGEFKSLTENKSITINHPAPSGRYKILVGNEIFIDQKKEEILPDQLQLSQNYPNPFNGQTVIEYAVPPSRRNSKIELTIYNVLGEKIKTLVNTRQDPGRYRVKWNGRNVAGSTVSSGIYLYRLQTSDNTKVKKMTFMK